MTKKLIGTYTIEIEIPDDFNLGKYSWENRAAYQDLFIAKFPKITIGPLDFALQTEEDIEKEKQIERDKGAKDVLDCQEGRWR